MKQWYYTLLHGWACTRILTEMLGALDSYITQCIHWQPACQATNVLTAHHLIVDQKLSVSVICFKN